MIFKYFLPVCSFSFIFLMESFEAQKFDDVQCSRFFLLWITLLVCYNPGLQKFSLRSLISVALTFRFPIHFELIWGVASGRTCVWMSNCPGTVD